MKKTPLILDLHERVAQHRRVAAYLASGEADTFQ